MANVFISYAHEDSPIARQLNDMLRASGQQVFFDEQALVSGVDFTNQAKEALAKADTIVVLLSRNVKRSNWVETELRSALQKGQRIIPVLLDEDATKNWVWPLISDRNAIRVDSPNRIDDVARQLNRALGATALPLEAEPSEMAFELARPTWLLVLLAAIVSAVATFLVTWLAR